MKSMHQCHALACIIPQWHVKNNTSKCQHDGWWVYIIVIKLSNMFSNIKVNKVCRCRKLVYVTFNELSFPFPISIQTQSYSFFFMITQFLLVTPHYHLLQHIQPLPHLPYPPPIHTTIIHTSSTPHPRNIQMNNPLLHQVQSMFVL